MGCHDGFRPSRHRAEMAAVAVIALAMPVGMGAQRGLRRPSGGTAAQVD
ncbi:hypothetical protein [Bradyrhizobium sp. DASA03120]